MDTQNRVIEALNAIPDDIFYKVIDLAQMGDIRRKSIPERFERKEIDVQYLGDEVTIQEGANLIKSPTGSGKTTLTKPIIEKMKRTGNSVLYIAPERALIDQLALNLGLDHYRDIQAVNSGDYTHLRNSRGLVITPNSLPKLQGTQWDCVIIDEPEAIFISLAESQIFEFNRLDVLACIEGFLRTSKTQILLDAYLSDITIDQCEKYGLSGQIIENVKQTKAGSTMRIYENQAMDQHTEDFLRAVRAGKKAVYITTNKTRINNKILPQIPKDKKVFSLTSDTPDKVRSEFIKNLPESANRYDVLILSPTVRHGFRVVNHHFEVAYASLGTAHANVAKCLQQIDRIKGVNDLNICFYDTSSKDKRHYPVDKGIIRDNLYNDNYSTFDLIGIDPLTAKKKITNPAFEQLLVDVTANRNTSKLGHIELFKEMARKQGYKIIDVKKDKIKSAIQSEKSKTVSAEISDKLKKSIEQASLLDNKQFSRGKRHNDNVSYEKTRIANILKIDGQELNDITHQEIEKGYLSKLNPLVMAITRKQEHKKNDLFEIEHKDFTSLKHHTLKADYYLKILSFAGINRKGEYNGASWTKRKLRKMINLGKRSGREMVSLGLINSRQAIINNPCKCLNTILKKIHPELVIRNKGKKYKGAVEYTYSINQKVLDQVLDHAIKIREFNRKTEAQKKVIKKPLKPSVFAGYSPSAKVEQSHLNIYSVFQSSGNH